MDFKPVFLWTDLLLYAVIAVALLTVWQMRGKVHLRRAWRQVFQRSWPMAAAVCLLVFVGMALLDSLHFRPALPHQAGQPVRYATQTRSVLDVALSPLGQHFERTYSEPFAWRAFVQETKERPDGRIERVYPHLRYAGRGIDNATARNRDVLQRIGQGVLWAMLPLFCVLLPIVLWQRHRRTQQQDAKEDDDTLAPVPLAGSTCAWMVVAWVLLIAVMLSLAQNYHILGTGKVGQDVLYQTIKSVRTGIMIGTLTTLVTLPFAIILGVMAGYFGGWVDDVIQYIYTTLSSVPGVLLIAAAILALQVFIANHTAWFPNLESRADARLLALCLVLGLTSWTGLCRLLRAETFKLRTQDFVKAAQVLGTRAHRILSRHILPNVMHIVLIAVVLDFSMLVLAEAVLSYVGVGVSPTTISWGNMINAARLELAREPVVWWPILAAFSLMFILVLSANIFADAVRDAFDPRQSE